MALQNFIARSLPTISAAWLNLVDKIKVTYDQTSVESSPPQNAGYLPGDVRRYGALEGTTDSSLAFTLAQTEVGSGGTITVIGTYRISQVDLLSNRRWDLTKATIESFNPETYMFRANGTSDIEIIGGLIDGRRGAAGLTGNFEFGFWLRGNARINFYYTRIKNCYEEGIFVGGDDLNVQCTNIAFYDVDIGNSGRNNLAVVHADGVYGNLVLHNAQDSTGHYAGPWAGVDIEPDNNQWVDNINLNIKTYNNDGNGVSIYGLAGTTANKSRITIIHDSLNDLRGLRFGRWPDRTINNELVVSYTGVIKTPTSTAALLIDTLGGFVALDLNASIQTNNAAGFICNLLKEAPGGVYAGTPKLRMNINATGEVDDLFANSSVGQVMTSNTIITIDASMLTVTAIGGQDNFSGHLVVITTAINPFENARPATANVSPTNVSMGERINTNGGAAGAIVLTLQNGSFLTDQEAEFYISDAQSMTVAISDNTKRILGFNDFEIIASLIGSRIRLKKMSTGDWRVIPSPRGQAFNWAATP